MHIVPGDIMDCWGLCRATLIAEAQHALVWKVHARDYGPAALKLYHRADRGNEAASTRLLSLWQDRGAVAIYAEAGKAVLMEWLEGPTLGDIARDGNAESALQVFSEMAHRLHQKPTVAFDELRPLHEVFNPLFDCTFARDCPDALQRDVIRATELASNLLTSQPQVVPLHGDLHTDNVIQTPSGARVIDAKGYLGDPAFELANALRHPKGMPDLVRSRDQIERCLQLYSGALGVSRKRLAQWAAAKGALSIMWRGHGTVSAAPEATLLNLLLRAADQ